MDKNLFEGSLSRFQAKLGAQTKFRNPVSAWVAQPLRGSLGPGGSRPLQTYTAELTCVGRSAQVGRSASAWVARPKTLSTQLKTLKSALPSSNHDLGAVVWFK